jgi:hypothetical protein
VNPRLVSNSEVQTFKECRRKWWLSWYRGLVSRTVEVQGVRNTGTRFHIAMEAYYVPAGQPAGNPFAALEVAQQEDWKIFAAQQDPSFPDEKTAKKLRSDFDLERIMLEGYLEWLRETGVDANLEVVASETFVSAPFLDGFKNSPSVTLIGKIDTRFRDVRTGRTKFMDNKTVVSFEDPRLLKINQQTLHYQLLLWLDSTGEEWCDEALYNMIRRVKRTEKAKPPFFKRESIPRNRLELEAYKRQLTGTITEMQEVERKITKDPALVPFLISNRPSRDCTWKCPFFTVCHMFDDGSRVEDAVERFYEVKDPLDYYGGKDREE